MSNVDVIKALYASFAKGDVPAVLGTLDPQVRWSEAEGSIYAAGNPYVGPDAVLNGVFMPLVSEIEQFTVSPENYIDGGNSVAVEGRYTGTVKSTGTPVNAQFTHIWDVRNGKVVRFQQYTDTRQWAVAYGRVPTP